MKTPRSAVWIVCTGWLGCGGAANEPAATPVEVAAVQPAEKTSAKRPADTGEADEVMARARAEEIAAAMAKLDVQTLGALGGSEPSDVLSAGEVPKGLLEEAARAAAAEGDGGGELRAGGGGGAIAAVGGSSVGALPLVRGEATVGPVTVNGGTLAHAEAVVSRRRSMFRRCYERALQKDPTQQGSLVVEIDVGKSGRVEDVRTAVRQGVGQDVAQCIEDGTRRMRFMSPSDDVTLAFQLRFEPR